MTDLGGVAERLDRFVGRSMAAERTPGMTVALTDRERTLRVAGYGVTDLGTGTPIGDGTRFEIGSIGKSFTAIALLRLADEGRVELQAPVTRYLPWFAVGGETAPITLHHLLSHTAGIVAGMDGTPDARSEVWALRETTVGGPPGERFHYSNVGYKALGLVLERVTGEAYPAAIRRLILEPLGMDDSEAAITHETRPRLAVGYSPLYDDRPYQASHPLVPATWLETETGDGSIVATAGDMAAYLRLLLNRGVGPRGRLLSETGFAALTRPATAGWGDGYGYGLTVREAEGRTEIGHPGGMVGYFASMRGDLDGGLGVVVLCNGPGAPVGVGRHALALLRAMRAGEPLPEGGEGEAPEAAGYEGRYVATSGGGMPFAVSAGDGGLVLARDGERVPLAHRWDDDFLADRPGLDRFPLRFERDGERVVGAVHGADAYAREGVPAGAAAEAPAAWAGYAGAYRAHNPWIPTFRVVLRGGELRLLFPAGEPDGFAEDQALVPIGEDRFRVGEDEAGPERIRFDVAVEGVMLRASLSGAAYWRVTEG